MIKTIFTKIVQDSTPANACKADCMEGKSIHNRIAIECTKMFLEKNESTPDADLRKILKRLKG